MYLLDKHRYRNSGGWGDLGHPLKFKLGPRQYIFFIASCTCSIPLVSARIKNIDVVVFPNCKAGDSVRLLHVDVTEEKRRGKICVFYRLLKKICIYIFTNRAHY